jgi:VWFA-related protein
MFSGRRLSWAISFLLLAASLHSQTDSANSAVPTFQSKVRAVLVDVTVTDRGGASINDLKQEDFEVTESGKPQTIASFEEHKAQAPKVLPPLPPHVYTNNPLNKTADSVNVLVLDALNTPVADQMFARQQMIKYLKQIDPGSSLAIFTLTTRLRIVEGFTADPSSLIAALNQKNWGGRPQTVGLLGSQTDNADQVAAQNLANSGGPGGFGGAFALQAIQQFLTEQASSASYVRIQMTLQSLQELARYLSGFPGRKNVIWFAGSFPISVLPTTGRDYDLSLSGDLKEKLRKTTNMLAAAQVAIYPIAPSGLTGLDEGTSARFQNSLPVAPGLEKGGGEMAESEEGHLNLLSNQATMDYVARDTGGEAFYNTNGLKEAMSKAVNNGAHYYSISYTPTEKTENGSYQQIQVKLKNGHYKLSYRRGYFSEDANKAAVQTAQSGDPLRPLMVRGLPASTQIIYKVELLPSDPQPAANSAVAGGNAGLKQPVTRYGVDFAISIDDLDFVETPDGKHHGSIEVTVVAYDHDGHALNWTGKTFDLALRPERYAMFTQSGLQLHQEIDVPKGDVFLRTGVYDTHTGKAGTLEVPLGSESVAAVHPTQ